jgi:hypothetical protein
MGAIQGVAATENQTFPRRRAFHVPSVMAEYRIKSIAPRQFHEDFVCGRAYKE